MMEYVNGDIIGKTDNSRITLLSTNLDRMIQLDTYNQSILVETENEKTNVSIHAKVDHGKINVFGEKNSRTVFRSGTNKVRFSSEYGKITVGGRKVQRY
jgi:hypothetical protein